MPAPLAALGGIVARVGGTRAAAAAARRAARGGPRAGAAKRLRRMKTKRMLRGAGRGFLYGAFGLDFDNPFGTNSGGGGGYGGGAGGRGGKSGGGPDVTLPSKKREKTYSKESNPSIDTISKQVGELVKIAKKLGITSEKQEAELIKASQTKERAGQESKLEAANDNDASMVGGGDLSGGAITALEPEINKLIKAISDLRESIESQGSGGGVGSALAAGAATVATLGRGGMQAIGKGASAVGRGVAAVGGKLSTAAEKIANKVGIGTAKAKKTVAAAGLKGAALKQAIAKVAKPLVVKGIAKTAIKSIPLVGAIAGLGFALGRLIKGDVVGAGLDAVSGLGGPLTAIPALVASLTRDVYQGVYGVYPEQDPLAGERLSEIKNTIEDIAKEELGEKVEKKEDKKPAAETLPPPTPRMEARPTSAPVPSVPSEGGASPASAPSGGGDASPTTSPAPTPEAGGSGGGGSPAAPTPEAKKETDNSTPPAPPISGSAPSSGTPLPGGESGAAISAASDAASAASGAETAPGSAIIAPATTPTTRPNATGMGDVPEPSYLSAGDLVKTIYFGAVAGAMAA